MLDCWTEGWGMHPANGCRSTVRRKSKPSTALATAVSQPRGGPRILDRVISYSRLNERRDVMGKVTRKRYGAEFKAKVALEAVNSRAIVTP